MRSLQNRESYRRIHPILSILCSEPLLKNKSKFFDNKSKFSKYQSELFEVIEIIFDFVHSNVKRVNQHSVKFLLDFCIVFSNFEGVISFQKTQCTCQIFLMGELVRDAHLEE
jgi:hypothetical protein